VELSEENFEEENCRVKREWGEKGEWDEKRSETKRFVVR